MEKNESKYKKPFVPKYSEEKDWRYIGELLTKCGKSLWYHTNQLNEKEHYFYVKHGEKIDFKEIKIGDEFFSVKYKKSNLRVVFIGKLYEENGVQKQRAYCEKFES